LIAVNIVLGFAIVLVILGFYCISVKRNMIKMIIGIEVMTNGAILSLVSFASYKNGFVDPLVHSLAVMAIAVGGCIAAVALSLVVHAYKHYKTLDIRELRRLRW